MYYGLTNFYQNHRRYVKSRDDTQLSGGTVDSVGDLISDCKPYRSVSVEEGGQTVDKPIAPCGAIANSMFNGKLEIMTHLKSHCFTAKMY